MLQIFAISVLATVAGGILVWAITRAVRRRLVPPPQVSVRFVYRGGGTDGRHDEEEIGYVWTAELTVINDSTTGIADMTFDLPQDLKVASGSVPNDLPGHGQQTFHVEARRTFSRREVFPADHATPLEAQRLRNIDPITECVPEAISSLSFTVAFSDHLRRSFRFRFRKRSDATEEELEAEQLR